MARNASRVISTLVLVSSILVVGPQHAHAATVVADYRFADSLASSAGSAPSATGIGSGTNTFVSEIMDRASRRVLSFPQGNGLSVATAGVIPTNAYSIAILFRLEDTDGWKRLIDFKNGTSENGLYQNYGRLNFYGGGASTVVSIDQHVYAQVVLTRSATGTVTGYVNGQQELTFSDTDGDALIESDELRLFRDDGTDHGPGAVARIRLYDGPLTASEAAALDDTPSPCKGDPNAVCDTDGATVVADYRFGSSLASQVGTPPALTTLGPGTSRFVTEVMDRQQKTVQSFPEGNGVQLTSTRGLIASNSYSIVMLFRIEDTDGWKRLIDFKNGTSQNGLYQNYGRINFYGGGASSVVSIATHVYAQVVLTRDRNDNVFLYTDGVQEATFQDTDGDAVIDDTFTLRFFRDDVAQHAPGAVSRIRIYDGPLTATEVAGLSGTQTPCKGDPNAVCDTDGAAVVADYRLDGSLASSAGSAPALTNVGPGTNEFAADTVEGMQTTVLSFPEGNGVQLTSTRGLIASNSYSIVMLFRIEDTDGWKRLIDFKNGTSQNGLYQNYGRINFYGGGASSVVSIDPGVYAQVVLTRDRNDNVFLYTDGVQEATFQDTDGDAVIDDTFTLRFFRDDVAQHAPGRVARIRIYDGPLTAAQVASLDLLGGNVIRGTPGADTITGTAGADVIYGGDGADVIDGGGGADVIYGEGGADTLIGGSGADRIYGGAGNDVITDTGPSGRLIGGSGNDKITGTDGPDVISGGSGRDRISPGGGDDEIDAGAGDDTVLGSGGADDITGGAGADSLTGGKGRDEVIAGDDDDRVFIRDDTPDVARGGAGRDCISRDGKDDVGGFETKC